MKILKDAVMNHVTVYYLGEKNRRVSVCLSSYYNAKMSPRRINNRQHHDPVLARYNTFLENSRLDENGNPFAETIFRIQQRQDWTLVKNKRILNSIEHNGDSLRHRADGPPSLFDIVRRFLNQNLKDLSIEALEGVPWSIMKCIWDDVLSS